MKLNGLDFTGKNLVIEEARKNHLNDVNLPEEQDLKVSSNQKIGPSNTEQIPPNRQSPFQKISNSYADTFSPKMKNVVIFSEVW